MGFLRQPHSPTSRIPGWSDLCRSPWASGPGATLDQGPGLWERKVPGQTSGAAITARRRRESPPCHGARLAAI